MASVLQRKYSSDSHPTDNLSDTALASLPFKFGTNFLYFQNAIRIKFLIENPSLSEKDISIICKEISRFRNEKNAFHADDIDSKVLSSLDLKAPLIFRRNINDIVNDCIIAIHKGLKGYIPMFNQYIGIVIDQNDRYKLDPILDRYPAP